MERGEESISRHFPLVWSLVRRLASSGVEKEDLFQAGCLGLLKASRNYDPSLGTAFSTYAVPVILGEMKRLLREGRPVKIPRSAWEMVLAARRVRAEMRAQRGEEPAMAEVADRLGVDGADLVAAEEAFSSPRYLEEAGREGQWLFGVSTDQDEMVGLHFALAQLEPRERTVIEGRYLQGYSQLEMAQKLGISQPQVSRLEHKALTRLRVLLGSHSGEMREPN